MVKQKEIFKDGLNCKKTQLIFNIHSEKDNYSEKMVELKSLKQETK